MNASRCGILAVMLLVSLNVIVSAREQSTGMQCSRAKILLDSKCHQGLRHLGTEYLYYGGQPEESLWQGKRLIGLQAALESQGYTFEVADIAASKLSTCTILVVAGRSDAIMFSQEEIQAISSFVQRGGSLLLMANHSGFVVPQNQLSLALDLPVTFHQTTVSSDQQKIELCANDVLSSNCVLGLSIRTSCTMALTPSPYTTVLARYHESTLGIFAVAVDRPQQGQRARSRTVIMPSSGHLASRDDADEDLWDRAGNASWMLQIFAWLAYQIDGANHVDGCASELNCLERSCVNTCAHARCCRRCDRTVESMNLLPPLQRQRCHHSTTTSNSHQ